MEFTYAHFNTLGGERETPTADLNRPKLSAELNTLRERACAREIPVSDGETLNFLQTLVAAVKPKQILEIGTAIGLSAAVMLSACKSAHVTTIEKDEIFAREASENFKNLGLSDKITLISGDAAEVLKQLIGQFDFIFLDGPKVQYVKYLPELKRLLKAGGVLAADDVLLFGYVTGEREVPKKRKMLVEHVKEYLTAVTSDPELLTTVLNIGNGVAVSVKND